MYNCLFYLTGLMLTRGFALCVCYVFKCTFVYLMHYGFKFTKHWQKLHACHWNYIHDSINCSVVICLKMPWHDLYPKFVITEY